jgi:fructosamine-3-kinase
MFLILSAAYVGSELRSEFGAIPPSFLPLGNRRLFQHQIKLVPVGESIYMSIPESYKVSGVDKNWLEENLVELIEIPVGLSLGESLVLTLNMIEKPLDSSLNVLFGDTLLKTLPEGENLIATAKITDNYEWSVVDGGEVDWLSDKDDGTDTLHKKAVCGYFKFSQPLILINSIKKANCNFLQGLNYYHQKSPLTAVSNDGWLDFGHVNTYYHSKVEFTTQRSFNELKITSKWIEKSSEKSHKIKAEANWFSSIPESMRSYIPQFLGAKNDEYHRFSYKLEYLHNTALNELYVFSEIPNFLWIKIISHCLDFIDDCSLNAAPNIIKPISIKKIFSNKTAERLSEFKKTKNISFDDVWEFNSRQTASINDLLSLSEKWLPLEKQKSSLIHGDFCFSNILYDFRANRIKTIDPRGVDPYGELSIYGDIRYDIAKLSHSILGMYDLIVAEYHSTDIDWEVKKIEFILLDELKYKNTQVTFMKMVNKRYGLCALNLYAMQLQLFLSMLPLHADDINRQNALFANAFRIYNLMKGYEK